MSKPYTHIVKPNVTNAELNRRDFFDRMATGDYVNVYSFIAPSGAYVAYMKGHSYHVEEVEAAGYLANAGYNVVFTPEGEGYEIYATAIVNGKHKYSEGTVSQLTFEQRTPKGIDVDAKTTIRGAIKHANTKHSQIALIYDRYNLFHREDIEEGMKYYQQTVKGWRKMVKAVLVVNSAGEVWEHQFDAR